MTLKTLRRASLGVALLLVLAACGTGGGGTPDPDPDPGPGPGPGEPGTISGVVQAAPAANLFDVTLHLCETGTDCAVPGNAVRQERIDTGTSQAAFRFSNVPEGVYTLLAFGPTGEQPT